MNKPSRQRGNPKARRIVAPPLGTDLAHVAASCRYVGSPYHKDGPSSAGTPRRRPDASICPSTLADKQPDIEQWLRQAVRAGQVGPWDGGFPR